MCTGCGPDWAVAEAGLRKRRLQTFWSRSGSLLLLTGVWPHVCPSVMIPPQKIEINMAYLTQHLHSAPSSARMTQ